MKDDIRAVFLHQFVAAARQRIALSLEHAAARDAAGMQVAMRNMHSLAGESGLLGLREILAATRKAEDQIKAWLAAPSDAAAGAVIATLEELRALVEQVGPESLS